MIKDGKGGGNTRTGLIFEGKTDLGTFLASQDGYVVENDIVYYQDEKVAEVFKKHEFYRFLEGIGVNCHYCFEYIPLAKLGLPVSLNSGGY